MSTIANYQQLSTMTEGADKCLAHRISRNTGHDQWRSVAQMLHFFFVFVAFENMAGTVLEKYVGLTFSYDELIDCF